MNPLLAKVLIIAAGLSLVALTTFFETRSYYTTRYDSLVAQLKQASEDEAKQNAAIQTHQQQISEAITREAHTALDAADDVANLNLG